MLAAALLIGGILAGAGAADAGNGVSLALAACELAACNLNPTEWDTYLGREGDWRATCPHDD
jgi:hypothetical protein